MDIVPEHAPHIEGHWFFRDSVQCVYVVFCLTVMQLHCKKMQTIEDTLGLNLLLHRSDTSMLGFCRDGSLKDGWIKPSHFSSKISVTR